MYNFDDAPKPLSPEAAEAELQRGREEAHITKLHQFSPAAAALVLALREEANVSDVAFRQRIEAYNAKQHALPGEEPAEAFTLSASEGRSIKVQTFDDGRVVLAGVVKSSV